MATKSERRKIRQEIAGSEFQFCNNPHEFYIAMGQMMDYGFTRDDLLTAVEKHMNYMSPMARREKSMYINFFSDLSYVYMDRAKQMISAPEEMLLMYMEVVKKKPIYRIDIKDDGTVHTTCYELLDAFNPELNNFYIGVDELPKWVQDKLAVLMLLDHTKQNEEVENIGRRIQENVFWVFKGEADGDDSRS